MGMHHIEENVLFRGIVMVDQGFRDAADFGEIADRGAEEPALGIKPGGLFDDCLAPNSVIGGLRSRHRILLAGGVDN